MTETSPAAPHQPGVYVKGDSVRIASSTSAAAALAFDGYALRGDEPAPEGDSNGVDYRDLQKQAKELDIPANQTSEELQRQIDAKLADES
jgi:hypothetical protein